ncbi:MAG: AMP-binding protein [Bacteroidales bacterium]|nr:AMP-binding protein [Bacteroidales bacterium]
MQNNHLTYHLNGKKYNPETIVQLCQQKLRVSTAAEWEKHIYEFILNWFNDEDHILVKTSGSTGKPKTIALKKSQMAYSARQTCDFFQLTHKSTGLLCLPAAYIAGKMMIVRALVCGFNLVTTEPSGDPFANLNEKIDFAAITPFQLFQSLETLKKGSPVKTLIVGGGEINPEMEKDVQDIPVKIFATYGMTETSSHIALRQVNGYERSYEFQVIGHTKIKTDNRNCLVLENPHLFDGSLYTNDIVKVISENRFRWLGRFDNIINSGGIKIIPEEIEKTIVHLQPYAMVVSSVPDKKLGEAVVLAVETNNLTEETQGYLLRQIKTQVQPYAIPRKIFCIPEFPRTDNGKINRKALKEFLRNTRENNF